MRIRTSQQQCLRTEHSARWRTALSVLALILTLVIGPGLSTSVSAAEEATPTDLIVSAGDPTEPATPEPTATDVLEPTATASPEPTATDTPEPTGTTAPEPSATETPTPSATSTPEPTATATPTEGPVELEFAKPALSADPGATARFELIVRNGNVPQTIDFATSSAAGWTVELLTVDEGDQSLLADSDDDGRGDIGRVRASAEERIVVTVAVPADTLAGTEDTLTVRVPGQPGERATLTVNPILIVDLAGSASFGAVNMLGQLDPSIPGLTSSEDAEGATYVRFGAIRITVTTNADWSLSCSLTGASPDLTERGSRLSWRLSGSEVWTPFTLGDEGPVCASGTAGTTVIELDLRMRVDLGDTAEQLAGTIRLSWDN